MKMKKTTKTTKGADGGATAMTVPVAELREADMNVHAKEGRGDETFGGLVESIRANGVIHRIVVRRDADGGLVVVDGHRRLRAARAAGLDEVPVEVRDVDADEALAVTMAANTQRVEDDPLLEAEAIERMLGAGMSREQVAASIGKSAAFVARRARLMSLAKPWRDFAKRVRCTVDMLERVAAHETALQERVAQDVGLDEYEFDGGRDGEVVPCSWGEFADVFARATMRISDAPFDVSVCAGCPSNTSCHEFLFDFMAESEDARCQDPACYARRNDEAVDALLGRLRAKGRPAIEVADRWRVPNSWEASEKSSAKHPQAYVFADGGLRRVLWSVPPPKKESAKPAATAEERAAEKAEKRRVKLVRSARDKVREAWARIAEGGAEAVKKRLGSTYDELAAKRLDREIGRTWIGEDFLDDFARLSFETATAAMDKDERDAYEAALIAADERGEAGD